METYLSHYLPILVFFGLAVVLSVILIGLSWLRGESRPDSEKLSSYECGFEPFEQSRTQFDVRFYLVAILFIMFDLEIAFMFPWAVTLGNTGLFGFLSMLFFLTILIVGFAYEWRKGALEWE